MSADVSTTSSDAPAATSPAASAAPAHRLRLSLGKVAPDLYKAQSALDDAVRGSGLDHALYELIKIRASQINGCAFCLDMHTQDARALGETEQRIHLIAAWREAPFYSDRERAALALTEAVTRVADAGVPDATRSQLSRPPPHVSLRWGGRVCDRSGV